jgi:hypothetical protein
MPTYLYRFQPKNLFNNLRMILWRQADQVAVAMKVLMWIVKLSKKNKTKVRLQQRFLQKPNKQHQKKLGNKLVQSELLQWNLIKNHSKRFKLMLKNQTTQKNQKKNQ